MYNYKYMKLRRSLLLLATGVCVCVGLECYAITSCNKTNSNFHLDYELKNQFNDWYNSLTNSPWNKDDNNNF